MPPAHQDPFLQCLSQMSSDAFAEMLLPMLIKQGSAHAVAATCSQLRDLCYRSVQDVVLRDMEHADVSTMDNWIQPLPLHFSNCTTLMFITTTEQDFPKSMHVMPALARLPKLTDIRLVATNPPMHIPMAMLLGSMRTSLPNLRVLTLEMHHSWPDSKLVWEELGGCAHLTALSIKLDVSSPYKQFVSPCTCGDLAPLSKLSNLQSFELMPEKWTRELPPVELRPLWFGSPPPSTTASDEPEWLQCLAGMTALTGLYLCLRKYSGLQNISACKNLVALTLKPADAGTKLEDADWAAVGQLTKLTGVFVCTPGGSPASAACYAALKQLTRLRAVGVSGWTLDALPVFQGLSCLTRISGNWLPNADSSIDVVCPQVRQMGCVSGDVPFKAFPQLEEVEQTGALTLQAVSSLHLCQELQQVWGNIAFEANFTVADDPLFTVQPGQDVVVEVAAIKSLASLPKLWVLGFKPADDTQLSAVIDVAVQLLAKKQLQRVGIGLEPGSRASLVGLMQLGRLAGLPCLDVSVSASLEDSLGPFDLSPLLSVLSGVDKVCFFASDDLGDELVDSGADMADLGLTVPNLVLSQLPYRS